MILDLFLNPVILVPLTAVMTIYYVNQKGGANTEVYLLRRRDRRGERLRAAIETDLAVTCKKVKGVTHRFIKTGPGYTFAVGNRVVTRFFGVEGTAYTGVVKGSELKKIPVNEYVGTVLGSDFYDKMPDEAKRRLEDDIIGVTVEIEKIDPQEHDLISLSSDQIHNEERSEVLKDIVVPQEKTLGQNIYLMAVWLVLGALLMYFLMGKGVV